MQFNDTYLFDLQGYLKISDVLSTSELSELNYILDQKIAQICPPETQTYRFGGPISHLRGQTSPFEILDWGKAYRNLIAHQIMTPYLEALLGQKYRLDHVYLELIRSGMSPIGATLHGGATPFAPAQYYHFRGNKMHNGLIVVAYNLHDVGAEDGGFACVAGSHKSNFPFPAAWKELTKTIHPCINKVTGKAGTAIIFTEALTHGALPWKGKQERRTLFLKYSPHPLSWSTDYCNAEDYQDLSSRQKSLLEPPNARYPERMKEGKSVN